MRYLSVFFIQLFFLSGVYGAAEIKWEIKDLPPLTYLYREHGISFGTNQENLKSNEISLEAVKSLIQEATKRNLNFITPAFFRFDLRAGKVIEVGLEIQGKNMMNTKIRTGGKFLEARYTGRLGQISEIFKEAPRKFKEYSLTPLKLESFFQKKTGVGKNADTFIILFPLKEN